MRRSAGSRWYFAECNVVPPFSTRVSIRAKKEVRPPTKHNIFQLFTELSVLPDRHRLLGSVLRQIEFDVSRELIPAGAGLLGVF